MRSLYIIVAMLVSFSSVDAKEKVRNVLFIAVDDMKVELGCYGQKYVISPHVDKLASQGTLFNNAFCQQTVCNPSRSSLLTGLRPDTLKVWDLPTHFRQDHPEIVTLPGLFKRNGYHSQCIGKIFHNWRQDDYRGDEMSWSVPSFLHYASHGNDKPKIKGELPPDFSTNRRTKCLDVPDNAYYDGRVADKAIATLEELSHKDNPFFLAVGFWKPHLPFNAPKKYWDLYDRDQLPFPDRLEPPKNVPQIALTPDRFDGKKNHAELKELIHGYLAAISYFDAQVGRVLKQLDDLGLRKNTIIVFWSDHGLHVGEHGLLRKTTVFDVDARVPLIIATPNHQAGQQTNAIVELLDIYPTLLELCEIEPAHQLEGLSLVPLLEEPSKTIKPVALTQTTRPNYYKSKYPEVMGYSIRNNQFRYTEWREFKTGRIKARELYDHLNDPNETDNVIERIGYRDHILFLQKQMSNSVGDRK